MGGSDRQGFPVVYRAELLGRLMPVLLAGESCALVGASGVGKTNLAQFLCRRDVQRHYWGGEQIWVVAVDTNGLVFSDQPPEYATLELIIHRLVMEAEARDVPPETVARLAELHGQVSERKDIGQALRTLERICGMLTRRGGVRLVLLFDQFEDLWRGLGARFFLNLRYLRDQYKYHLAYLVITRRGLQRLREDLPAVEAFYELFTSHTYGITALSEQDQLAALGRILARRQAPLDAATAARIVGLSGGHVGLLRALYWALQADPAPPDDALALHPAVADECRKIWVDLNPAEQRAARAIAGGAPARAISPDALQDLTQVGLVLPDPPRLFTELFHAFVLAQSAEQDGVVVDLRQRLVWVDGQLLAQNLSPLEFALLALLARNAGQVCTREEILRELYGDRALEANDERLDTIVRRLRETLGEDARSPRYLVTHRGVGFQLARGRLDG